MKTKMVRFVVALAAFFLVATLGCRRTDPFGMNNDSLRSEVGLGDLSGKWTISKRMAESPTIELYGQVVKAKIPEEIEVIIHGIDNLTVPSLEHFGVSVAEKGEGRFFADSHAYRLQWTRDKEEVVLTLKAWRLEGASVELAQFRKRSVGGDAEGWSADPSMKD